MLRLYSALTIPATVHTVTAKNEIVLSAGSFGTPTILQLSGIGDKAELASVGITAIVNNPSVGHNMSDHALVSNVFQVNNPGSFDTLFRDSNLLNANIGQWLNNQTGPLADGVANHLGYLRLPKTADIFKTTADPSAGPVSSHFELIFSVSWFHQRSLDEIPSLILTIISEPLGGPRNPFAPDWELHERNRCPYFSDIS